ncbi:hypothetical protein D3C72_1603960 [compost metagenome]
MSDVDITRSSPASPLAAVRTRMPNSSRHSRTISRTLVSSSTTTTTAWVATPASGPAIGIRSCAGWGAPSYRGRCSLTDVPTPTALSSVAAPPACLAKP